MTVESALAPSPRTPESLGDATVLYVASDIRSGSTLLDLLLGAHPDVISLGELRLLSDHVRRRGVGHSWNWRCTCGDSFGVCPFWRSVDEDLRRTEGTSLETLDVGTATHGATFPMLVAFQLLLHRSARLFPPVRRNFERAKNYWKVIDVVVRRTSKRVIVDSSKIAEHFLYIHAVRPDAVRLLYLVRDGRGVTMSRMHRSRISLLRAITRWVRNNVKILIIQAAVPRDRRLFLTYEALCADPHGQLARIWSFVGIEPAEVSLTKNDRHNVAGSPHRFETRETAIRVDDRWRSTLTRSDLWKFRLLAGWLNRWFGYR